MERKIFERRVIGSLIILLIAEIALLALHLGWGGFTPPAPKQETLLAGHVKRSENELRRRGANSLVWEKSASDDAVYFYDSILTLAQSTATLKLFRDTELKLSENTLVTIEPQDQNENGEIRLKFTRGNLKARNPYVKTKLSSESWVMDIQTGSDVELRQVGDGEFELDVKRGSVGFSSEKGLQSVGENEVLRVNQDAPSKIRVDENLSWQDPPKSRIYTHSETVALPLRWKGEGGAAVVVQSVGGRESVIPVAGGRNDYLLELPLGRHQIFLRAEGLTSPGLSVEIWKAPSLHLLSPLPRDRMKLGADVNFVWMRAPEISGYQIHIHGQKQNLREESKQNTFTFRFDQEDDLEWSVEGRDSEGNVIPPNYSHPLFIRESPLEAPKLMRPQIRRPAEAKPDRGASLWNWILPQAYAEDSDPTLYQAAFRWEPVAGADRYVIEISESADFRRPIVNKVVSKPEYVWKKMELKTYYWRVAAESKGGRMGIFSEPQETNLKDANSGVEVTPLKEVVARPAVPAEPEPPPRLEPPPVAETPPPPPMREPQPAVENLPRNFFEWRPLVSALRQTNGDSVRTTLQGPAIVAFSMGTTRTISRERFARVQVNAAQFKYKPHPESQFPSQKNISWTDVDFLITKHNTSSHYSFGFYALKSALISRETESTVHVRDAYSLGVVFEGIYQFDHVEYVGDYMGVFGNESGFLTRQSLRFPGLIGGFYLGAGVEGRYLIHSGGNTQSFSGQFSLGLDF